jgi:hypothetical protein
MVNPANHAGTPFAAWCARLVDVAGVQMVGSTTEHESASVRVNAARAHMTAYESRALPVSLRKPTVPPWVRELTRLLARLPSHRHPFGNLQQVEQLLRMPGSRLTDLPDTVLAAAGQELRRLARRDTPTPALARLLDQFEAQVVQPAQRRLYRNETTQ